MPAGTSLTPLGVWARGTPTHDPRSEVHMEWAGFRGEAGGAQLVSIYLPATCRWWGVKTPQGKVVIQPEKLAVRPGAWTGHGGQQVISKLQTLLLLVARPQQLRMAFFFPFIPVKWVNWAPQPPTF